MIGMLIGHNNCRIYLRWPYALHVRGFVTKEILGSIASILDDNVRWSLRCPSEIILEDVLDTRSISCLSIKSRARHMGHHRVSSSTDIFHSAPRVILGSWLREPYITSVSAEMASF
jgi:hypothetical protein